MVGIGSLSARVRFLKIGLRWVIRIDNVVIRTGPGLLVICGKNIDGWGISNGPRLALYHPKIQMFENLFYDILVLYERSVNFQVIKSGDSIAQNAAVSVSALGSILPGIRNLAIACTAMYLRR